jgi:peroxiredoxin
MQNPSLLLAVADNTMADLLDGAKDVHLSPQQAIDKVLCDQLTFTASDGRAVTLLFDAQTHLLRQARYDLSKVFIERGAPDVKAAAVTIDYAESTPDASTEEFAWVPPEGAREQVMGRPMTDTSALEGQPAPDFKLKGLDGKEVQLAGLKNQVIVLDFFATWCPACVYELPDINMLYEQRKGAIQVFAVNVKEDAADVKAFVSEKKLTLPVLLDTDAVVSDLYGMWALPQTVVIGRDGKVKKVFIGIPEGGPADIGRAVDAALEGK